MKRKQDEERRAAEAKRKLDEERQAAAAEFKANLQELDKNILKNIPEISRLIYANSCFDDQVIEWLPNYFKSIRQARDSVKYGGPFVLSTDNRELNSALANVTLPAGHYIDNHNNALCLVCHKLLESTENWEMRMDSFRKWIDSCDIDYTKTSRDGSTVFHMLATRRHDKSIEIVNSILDVNKPIRQVGRTPSGRTAIIPSGLNVSRPSDSKTALNLAIDNGFVDVATLLVQSGASYQEIGLLDDKHDKMDEWMAFAEELFRIRQNEVCDVTDIFGYEPLSAPGVTVSDDDTSFTAYYTLAEPSIFEYIKSLYKLLLSLETKLEATAEISDAIPIAIELADAYVRFGVVCVRHPDMFSKSELETILSKYFELIKTYTDTFNNKIHPCMLSAVAHYYSHNQSDGGTLRCKSLLDGVIRLCSKFNLKLHMSDNELKERLDSSDWEKFKSKVFNSEFHRKKKDKMDKYKQFVADLKIADPPLTEEQIKVFESILLDKVGIDHIKNLVISIYTSSVINKRLKKNGRESEIVAGNYQYIFAGNPGTGKTTIGKSMAKILSICGIRSDTFKQYTGTELLHIGSTKFLADIEQMRGSRSGGGPSSDDLPKDRFLEQEIVEVNCNGTWYEAEIVRKQNSLPSLNKDGTVAQSEDKYEVKFAKYNDTVPFSKIRRVNRTRRAGGTIFIDECYDLQPSSNKDGKLILGHSLTHSSTHLLFDTH